MATCSECSYIITNSYPDEYGRFGCEKTMGKQYKGRCLACDDACYRFCKAYGRSTMDAKVLYNLSKEKSKPFSFFYIATAICEILGTEDYYEYLEVLRNFRVGYLEHNPETADFLNEYEQIGPVIASNLRKEENKKATAELLFDNFIIPTIMSIDKEDYNEATKIYSEMTKYLCLKYGVNTELEPTPYSKEFKNKQYSLKKATL